jgi:hypothetical protein
VDINNVRVTPRKPPYPSSIWGKQIFTSIESYPLSARVKKMLIDYCHKNAAKNSYKSVDDQSSLTTINPQQQPEI